MNSSVYKSCTACGGCKQTSNDMHVFVFAFEIAISNNRPTTQCESKISTNILVRQIVLHVCMSS